MSIGRLKKNPSLDEKKFLFPLNLGVTHAFFSMAQIVPSAFVSLGVWYENRLNLAHENAMAYVIANFLALRDFQSASTHLQLFS